MFSAIAPRYDLLNRILSLGLDRRWRRVAIASLGEASSGQVLDVATGTGDLGFAVLKNPEATVIGVDISESMLVEARNKATRMEVAGRITFVRGAAEQLPVESGTFDAAVVGFGVRNFQDLHQALIELRRVLRPGGRLVVLEFGQPKSSLVRWANRLYGKWILPRIGQTVSRVKGAYTYLPESIEAFPHGDAFLERMRAAGWVNLHARPLTFGVVYVYLGFAPAADR